MKNNVKIIIAFILGLIIAGSIGVYAAIKIQASEIGYKDGTVNDALNDLYTEASKDIYQYFGTPTYYESHGTANLSRALNQSVTKGKYLALISEGQAWNYANEKYASEETNADISCTSNNCVINKIGARFTRVPSSTAQRVVNNRYYLYYIEIKESTDTINISQKSTTYTTSDPQYLNLMLVPINK